MSWRTNWANTHTHTHTHIEAQEKASSQIVVTLITEQTPQWESNSDMSFSLPTQPHKHTPFLSSTHPLVEECKECKNANAKWEWASSAAKSLTVPHLGALIMAANILLISYLIGHVGKSLGSMLAILINILHFLTTCRQWRSGESSCCKQLVFLALKVAKQRLKDLEKHCGLLTVPTNDQSISKCTM